MHTTLNFTRRVARPAVGLLLATLCVAAPLQAQNALESVDVETGTAGAVEVVLGFSGAVSEPTVFTTDSPARIALDFMGTSVDLDRRTVPVGTGATRSVTAVEANGRTRVVIDLFRSAAFETAIVGNEMTISIGAAAGSMATTGSSPILGNADEPAVNQVSNVDFRRGPTGEGRILVDFEQPGATVDVRRDGELIIADLFNVGLPAQLERRLDVIDFATPVQMIDVTSRGQNTRLVIDATGEYEHLAYQTGGQFVLEVREVLPEAEDEIDPLAAPEYEGQRVTFNFQDIPVRSALQLIADVSALNIVVSDSVTGNVTLRLQNVPWDQALDIILDTKGLDKRQNGNLLWIAPTEEIAAREQQRLQAAADARELEPLRSTFVQVNYAKAEDLQALIQERSGGEEGSGFLSDRGSVSVDQRTNTLLVTDTTDRLNAVRELVTRLDRPVRQVQIESRIVIATSDFRKDIGVRFGLTSARQDSDGNVFSTAGSVSATDRMSNAALQNRAAVGGADVSNFPVVLPNPQLAGPIAVPGLAERLNVNLPAPAGSSSWALTVLAADYLLDLELSALEADGRGEVISSPRMMTTNQKEAFIQQGVEIPYQEATSSGATSVTFKEAVLELRATPLITPDNRIVLDLNVKQDTVGELFLGVPSVDTREINTQVLVNNGQTVVLGGVYEQTRREETDKVPLLGDIPAVGALFRNRLREDDKAELLIFVTPTVLDDRLGFNN